jgi:cytochrome c-type biogenesis protein
VIGLLGGTTLVASFLGGVVALFAPCCISVMLPAYFATSFGRRLRLVAMTFVFAAGLAAVILPISLGAASLGAAARAHHLVVFLTGGVLMLALGAFTLLGGKLPMLAPGMRAGTGRGPVSVFALGLFSGVASSCCAPVLAGVAALAGVSGSFGAALTIGVAYVFGMVAPLFVLALVWDRFDWGRSRLVRGRMLAIPLGRRRVSVDSTSLLSGGVMVAMGLLTIALALRGPDMTTSGWQVRLSAGLQHAAHVITRATANVPGIISVALLAAFLLGLAWVAINQAASPNEPDAAPPASIPVPAQKPREDRESVESSR